MSARNRRHDDYRPASLANFWRGCQNAIWKLEHGFHRMFDIAVLAVFLAVLAASVCLAAFVLRFVFWG